MSTATATASSSKQSSSQMPIIQGHEFNPERDIKYTKCKTNASGGKSVGVINTHTGQSLYIGTPLLMTWGVQDYTDEKSGKVSYELALQFPNPDFDTDETRSFLKAMTDFEQKLKTDALVNSKEWFAKPKMTHDAVDALFTPVLKYPMDKATCEKDMTRRPTLKVKVPFWQNKFEGVEIYDVDRNCLFPCSSNPGLTPKDIVTKMSHIVTMLQCGGIWFANGKFGVTWRFVQGMIQPKLSMHGRCHLSITPSDRSKLQSESQKSITTLHQHGEEEEEYTHQQKQQPQFSTETVDSDDGGSDGEEDDGSALKRTETVSVPVPVVASVEAPLKKKIVKKVA